MPYYEAIYQAELIIDDLDAEALRSCDQAIQDANDALMLEAYARIDMSIMATLVA